MNKFNVGNRIRLKMDSHFIGQSRRQTGVIITINQTSHWAKVKWDYGYEDHYPIEDFIPAKITNWKKRLE